MSAIAHLWIEKEDSSSCIVDDVVMDWFRVLDTSVFGMKVVAMKDVDAFGESEDLSSCHVC